MREAISFALLGLLLTRFAGPQVELEQSRSADAVSSAVFDALDNTCQVMARTKVVELAWPSSSLYLHELSRYWSTGCGALKPSCVLYPSTPGEVAEIVSTLGANNESFAIKSGGHNANQGFSSVHNGPLISMKRINHVRLDSKSETVDVGPGNRWQDVTAALDGTGHTVVGGRVGDVGVGGNLLGGGLSFLSTQYGWAANNIIAYQVILANATIVTASSTSHPDLYAALKGGGNNFGIVTSFRLKTHPISPKIWGGRYLLAANAANNAAMLQAVRDFTEYYPDPKAGIIAVANKAAFGLVNVWVVFAFYDGPSPPDGIFDNFTALEPFVDTTRRQSYDSLLRENNWGIIKKSEYFLATETMPLPSSDDGPEVLGLLHRHWEHVSRPVTRTWGLIASLVFQPVPRSLARLARARGGDLLDLDDETDRLIIELDYSFWYPQDKDRVGAALDAGLAGIREQILAFTAQGTLPDVHLPLFMNDAGFMQDYFGRLGPEKRGLAKRVRDSVDPNGFWRDRTGGYKIPETA